LETQIRKLEEKCENHEMRLQKLERDVLELKATLAASKRGATVEREPPLPIRNFMQEFESRIEAMTQRLQTDIRVIIAQEFRALDSLVAQRLPAQTPMFTSASFTQAQPPTIQAQRQQYW
jgi:flagellar biosynthesis chaperone FliJ